ISYVGASIDGGVGVQGFLVEAGLRDSDAVARANHRGRVQNDDKKILRAFAAANKGEDAVIGVVAIQPLKAAPIEIHFVQSRFRGEKIFWVGGAAECAALGTRLE